MEHERLRSCPFCGGPAKVKAQYSERKGRYYISIICEECGARSKTFTSLIDPAKQYTDALKFSTMLWNRRPNDLDNLESKGGEINGE